MAWPPTWFSASTTITDAPASRATTAAGRPVAPDPMTTTSASRSQFIAFAISGYSVSIAAGTLTALRILCHWGLGQSLMSDRVAALIAWMLVVRVGNLVKDGAKRRRFRRSSILDKIANTNRVPSKRSRPLSGPFPICWSETLRFIIPARKDAHGGCRPHPPADPRGKPEDDCRRRCQGERTRLQGLARG